MNQPFTFSSAQLDLLGERIELQFIRSLARFLRAEVPGAGDETEASVLSFTQTMVAKAQDYGLLTKRDVAIYVASVCMLGIGFEEHFRPAKTMLTSSLPGPDKAAWLQRATVALIDSKGQVR